ncbi:hypothetical protein MITS9509_00480 [Synechococcus sp. MIT S9509]|nr:hypothetical protein MITS9509_00480 [Synechococcus sp. MIT S9509]
MHYQRAESDGNSRTEVQSKAAPKHTDVPAMRKSKGLLPKSREINDTRMR